MIAANKKESILNIYVTAGYPEVDSLPAILECLDEEGVDMVEVGFPYSDPLADGSIIQNSSAQALENGITVDKIFDQLDQLDLSLTMVGMAYFNTILRYGLERFCKRCVSSGIKGLILPDLPFDIYMSEYRDVFETHGLSMIFMVCPQTSEDRIRLMDEQKGLFLYAVSSASTTGQNRSIEQSKVYFERLKNMRLESPVLVGFNIKSASDFSFVSSYVNGGIVGSAFINALSEKDNIKEASQQFIRSIRSKNLVS